MKRLIVFILLMSLTIPLVAVPRFAAREGVDCATCHVFPGGGAARTSYGKEFVKDYLAVRSNDPIAEILSGLPERLLVGADLRTQMFSQPAAGEMSVFPMQVAAYAGAEWDQFMGFAQGEYRNDAIEMGFSLRWSGLPMDGWLSYAWQTPGFGQKIDDHTAFIRGGNLTLMGLNFEGMALDPFIDRPSGVALGAYPLYWLSLQLGTGTAFAGTDEDVRHLYARADVFAELGPLGLQFNGSYLQEGDLSFTDIGGLVHWEGAVLHSSFVLGENWPLSEQTSIAVFHELSWPLRQGIDLVGRYEFFDPDTDLSNGSISRTSLGVEYFPLPGLEVKTFYRLHGLENADFYDEDMSSQLLLQLHLYL